MTKAFNMLDHLDQLTPVDERGKKGYYHCPVCGDDNFTVSKTGAYQCWGQQCKEAEIRNAVSPSKKRDSLPPLQRQKLAFTQKDREVLRNTAEVEAKCEELALLVAENIYSSEQAALSLSEWCRTERRDRYTAQQVLKGLLEKVAPSDETQELETNSQELEKLVLSYIGESKLSRKLILRKELRSRFRLSEGDVEAVAEELQANADLDFVHCSESHGASMDWLSRIEALQAGKLSPGLMTGFKKLDQLQQGLQRKTLHFVCGASSHGKTAFVQTIVRNVQRQCRLPTAVFNLEMSSDQWKTRWVSAERGIPHARLKTGKINEQEWDQVLDCMAHFYELPIFLSEASGITPSYLKRSCDAISDKLDKGLGLVVIDYINLMRHPGYSNRVQEVSQIARDLQALAKHINAPVLVLSQLNRGNVNRGSKEPEIDDIRETKEIEAVADSVMFVHRPSRYDKSVPDDEAKILIPKNRHGPTGNCDVIFEGKYMRFRDPEGGIW